MLQKKNKAGDEDSGGIKHKTRIVRPRLLRLLRCRMTVKNETTNRSLQNSVAQRAKLCKREGAKALDMNIQYSNVPLTR